jgi:uncharacterized membrane protein (UPF0127 family)
MNHYKTRLFQYLFVALSAISSVFTYAQTDTITAAPNSNSFAIQELKIDRYTIQAEVVATPEARQTGLMGRTSLPVNGGMLFVFEEAANVCFWMKDTPLALTIGFIDEQGILINTEDMQPFDENHHCPSKPAKYALEMKQGWFANRKLEAGIKIIGLPE